MESQQSNTPPTLHFKTLQINLQKKPLANTEMLQCAKQNNIDILIIQEPHIIPTNKEVPQTGKTNTIILTKEGIHYHTKHKSPSLVAIMINQILIINAYAAPIKYKRSIFPLLCKIEKLIHTHKEHPILLCGDFNTGTALFKTTKRTPNSAHFDEFIIANNLAIQNYDAPTWTARGLYSTIDYTLTKQLEIENWKISPYYSQSDHVYIEFTIPGIPTLAPNKNTKIHIDKEKFRNNLANPPTLKPYTTPENTETNALLINNWIATVLENATTTLKIKTKP